MMPKMLALSLAGALTVSAAGQAVGQTGPSSTTTGPMLQSPQNQMAPVPTQTPQLSQPSAPPDSAQPVSKITNAEQKLAAAKVQDMLGRPVGNIQSVHTSAAGTVTSAQVALNTQTEAGKTVTIPASQLLYDAHSRVVVAQLVQTEIDALPATTPRMNGPPRGQ